MSDQFRLKTLDTLLAAGVYVNDYPGFVLDKKDISYFSVSFPRMETESAARTAVARAGRKRSDKVIPELLSFISDHNARNSLTGTEGEIRVFYLDDQGFALLGRVEDAINPLVFRKDNVEITGERIFQINLTRLFRADGLDGPYEIRTSESKDVYEGLQKFISVYTHGWLGLFRQYSTVKERTLVFRQFKPFKVPFFGNKETLKNTIFRIQFGVRTPDGDAGYKWISTKYGEYTLQDAISVK